MLGALKGRSTNWFYYSLFIFAIVVAAAVTVPLLYMVIKTVGSGYEAVELLLRRRTLDIIGRSILLALTVTLFSILISLPLAWLLFRAKLPARRFWLVVTVIPAVIPSYVGGFVMLAAFGPKGIFQQFLSVFGVEKIPEIYGFGGAAIVLSLLRYPYMLLPVSASLSKLDVSLEESSRSLGHGMFSTYIRIILPQLKPAIATGCVFTSLAALSDFGAVSLLRFETFTWAIFLQYKSAFNIDIAAVLSLVVLVIAVIFLLIEGKSRNPSTYYSRGFVKRRVTSFITMGRWKVPAFLFLSMLVILSLIIPSSVLVYWLVIGISSGQTFPHLFDMIINSVYISLISALITVIAAFPVAYLSCRYNSSIVNFIERITHIGFAIPGIVVALSLVYFGIRYAKPVYQTHILLVAAYVVLFLPICTGTMRNLILQVNTNLEDASRSLGRSRFNTIRNITLPLIKPGIVAGFILSFLLTLRELPATLILSPFGFRTLATGIWSATSETFLAQSAMYSLVLIITASVPMVFLLLRGIGYKA